MKAALRLRAEKRIVGRVFNSLIPSLLLLSQGCKQPNAPTAEVLGLPPEYYRYKYALVRLNGNLVRFTEEDGKLRKKRTPTKAKVGSRGIAEVAFSEGFNAQWA